MLNIRYIKENKDDVLKRLALKRFFNTEVIENAISIYDKKNEIQKILDDILAESNQIAKRVGQLMKEGKKDEAEQAKQRTSELKEKSRLLSIERTESEESLKKILSSIPNLPHSSVPEGTRAEDNVIVREDGKMPNITKDAVPHWDLAKKYDIIDFELGNKITGAGFPVYKGKGAKLQRALINFFLDEAEKAGYEEVMPPIVVNEASGFGTGQLPDKDAQMYYVGLDNFYLIPTAEVPVTNIYRDVILSSSDFPIKNVAYTPCFRREAGSYGKDVRGLNRLHQFDKVEIVNIQHPAFSYQTLEEMVKHVENLIVKLSLPYRILRLCGGDMSFTSALTFDFEVYSAAQEKWLEVSSVSNFEEYQANRLKLRFKDKASGKTMPAHTLNGSALALPRIVAALLENNQTEKGIVVPECLRAFTGFDMID